MAKYVYVFGNGKAEGTAEMKGLLGGKGANLAEMTNIGLPVPAGFTMSTEVCTYYYANKRSYPTTLKAEVAKSLKKESFIAPSKILPASAATSDQSDWHRRSRCRARSC